MWYFYLGWVNNHQYTWPVVYNSMLITNNRSPLWSFQFRRIFHRKWILLHKSELNWNQEKRNWNQTEQIVLRFSGISVTHDSLNINRIKSKSWLMKRKRFTLLYYTEQNMPLTSIHFNNFLLSRLTLTLFNQWSVNKPMCDI